MIEVELKARVRDRAAVEARLRSFAERDGSVDKLDTYWHGPGWRRARGAKGFRLRTEGGSCVVTFKDKRRDGGFEVNREREFEVSDPEAFIEFAQRLGCERYYGKRKRGSRFRVAADDGPDRESRGAASGPAATVELVEVEGLGDFLEIEILVPDGNPDAADRARGEILGILERAGLGPEAVEPRYYSELLTEAGLAPRATRSPNDRTAPRRSGPSSPAAPR